MRIARTITLGLFLCAMPLLTANAQSDRRDGNFWMGMDQSAKTYFVLGVFDGMNLGNKLSYWSQPKERWASVTNGFSTMTSQYFGNTKASQMRDGLNEFYKDFRNRGILILDAVWLVANSISGKPQAEMDTMIENYRKSAQANP